MAVINIRVNDEVKKEAEIIFKSLGLNMSVAMNLFLKKCINENGIPFDLKLPNNETIEALEETNKILNGDIERKSYKNADIIYVLDLPKYIYKFRIIKRFIKRKLKLEAGKKETLKSLSDLLKWADKFQNEDMKEIIKILEKYREKVYFIKNKNEIKKI